MNKKVLAIVEGEKADLKLMNHLLNIFFKDEFYVWPYKTNIYAFYDKLQLNDIDDFETLDIPQVLKSQEADAGIKAKLDEKYTDIIMIFDYDPQDPRFSYEKILKLKTIFNESTDIGKLYLNYPMVESFKHFKTLNDLDFENRICTFQDLIDRKYKHIVSQETIQTDFERYTEEMCLCIFKQQIMKAQKIISGSYSLPQTSDEYIRIDTNKILTKQNEALKNNNFVFVLCTCCFFFFDYKPNYFLNLIRNK